MNVKQIGVSLAAALLVSVADVPAHHSQVAVYQTNAEQRIEGELLRILLRTPHSWVHVEARDQDGRVRRYAVEWGGASELLTSGINGQTLKAGDKVRVTGRPGRNPDDNRLRMLSIERPADGWSWGLKPGEEAN